jgi:hypothetical protein
MSTNVETKASNLKNEGRTAAPVSACCTPKEQESCCEPSAKAECCGTVSSKSAAPSSCGCR